MNTMNPTGRFFMSLGVAALIIGMHFRHDIQVTTTHFLHNLRAN